MKKFLLIILSVLCLAACDDGDIVEKYSYQQEGIKVAVDVNISGTESWPDGYSVTLSGFEAQRNDKDIAEYSEITKQIIPAQNGSTKITLGGIPQTVNYLEITVLNRIRQRMITLWQHELTTDEKDSRDTIRINAGSINAGMFQYIQSEYLTPKCSHCHSGTPWAAGLSLKEGESYKAMINVMSQKRNTISIVTPGDTAASALHLILRGNLPEATKQHTDILPTDADKDIIDMWIMAGAKP